MKGRGVAYRFEIWKDKIGEYRVRFRYNSEVIWSSDGYTSKASAMRMINSIKRNGPAAPVNDPTNEIENLKRRLANAPIPAADRVVRLDHNSAEFDEFSLALRKLTESIRTTNDFGDLTEEEVEVMKSEVLTIVPNRKQEWVRPAHIWQVAKSTFLWIAERAAGAVVSALALAALAALAAVLGIHI